MNEYVQQLETSPEHVSNSTASVADPIVNILALINH